MYITNNIANAWFRSEYTAIETNFDVQRDNLVNKKMQRLAFEDETEM